MITHMIQEQIGRYLFYCREQRRLDEKTVSMLHKVSYLFDGKQKSAR